MPGNSNSSSHTLVIGGVRHTFSFLLTAGLFNIVTQSYENDYFYLHKRAGFLHLDRVDKSADLVQDFYAVDNISDTLKNSFDVLFFERCSLHLTSTGSLDDRYIETCKFYLKKDGYILIQGNFENLDKLNLSANNMSVLFTNDQRGNSFGWALIKRGEPDFDKLPEDAKELILKSGWRPPQDKKDKQMSSIEIHGRYGKR